MNTYNNTDQHLHHICQTITKVNKSLVPKKTDDSHTNLYFDSLENRIYGRWFSIDEKKYILYLDLDSFTITLQNHHFEALSTLKLADNTISNIEDGLSEMLSKIHVEDKNIMSPLHYDIPEYSLSNVPFKKINQDEIKTWVKYRTLANSACYKLLGHLQSESEVRIWPHHFDTGIYTEINEKTGIGFGLAMQDDMVGEPYFYFSAYGLDGNAVDYKKAKPLSQGKWIVDNWKGGVLQLSETNEETILSFLKETTHWAISN
jgi:hypothetical protein